MRKTHKLAIDCRVEAAAGHLDVLGVLDGLLHRRHELVIDSGSGATEEHVMFFAFLMSVSTIFEAAIDCRIRAVQVKRVIQRVKRRSHRLRAHRLQLDVDAVGCIAAKAVASCSCTSAFQFISVKAVNLVRETRKKARLGIYRVSRMRDDGGYRTNRKHGEHADRRHPSFIRIR